MAPERFSSSLALRHRAHFVSAANWTRVRVKNMRKMATKSTPPKDRKQPRYQWLRRWLGRKRSRSGKNANNFNCVNQYEKPGYRQKYRRFRLLLPGDNAEA